MDKLELAEKELAAIDAQIAMLRERRNNLLRFIEMGHSLFKAGNTGQHSLPIEQSDASAFSSNAAARAELSTELLKLSQASMRARIIQVAEELIAKNGAAQTREIVKILQARSTPVTGENFAGKVLTASAVLSKSGKFVADRANGWKLKEESKNP